MNQPLARSATDKFIGGVCGGLARSFGIDPSIVRIIFVALAIFGFSTGVLVYLVLWLILPVEGGGPSGIDDLRRTFSSGPNSDLR